MPRIESILDNDPAGSTEKIAFPGFYRSELMNLFFALAISIAAFLLYYTCTADVSFPGAPASTLVQIAGVSPNLISRHFVWRWILQHAMTLFGGGDVHVANITCAVFGAMSVGLLYLVVHGLMSLMTGIFGISPLFENDALEISWVATVAGFFSASGLAISVPFWFSTIQVYPHSFYLCWMLLAMYLMILYMAYGSKFSLAVFSILWGTGMAQSGIFIAWAPFLLVLIAKWLSVHNRRRLWPLAAMILLCSVGTSLLLVETNVFRHSEGSVLLNYPRYATLVLNSIVALLGDITSLFHSLGWLIVLTTSLLPFLAMLFLFRGSTDEASPKSLLFFNAAIMSVALVNILDLKISAWNLLGGNSLRIVPTAMIAVVFGYSVSIFYFQLRNWQHVYIPDGGSTSPDFSKKAKAFGWISWLLAVVALLVWGGGANLSKVNNRPLKFLQTYVDKILDKVTPEQHWVLTDGTFDDVIQLRALERGLTVRTLNVTVPRQNKIYYQQFKSNVVDENLRRVLDLGMIPFVQEWISTSPTVARELILTVFPDIWVLGGYEVISDGIVFKGIKSDDYETFDTKGLAVEFKKYAEALRSQLNVADRSKSLQIRRLAGKIRSLASLNGNNLAYMIDRHGTIDDAIDLYAFTCWLDPENISALLNYSALILTNPDTTEESKMEIKHRLESIPDKKRNLPAVVLTSAYGYLRWTGAIAKAGIDWAVIGNDALSIKMLNQALEAGGFDDAQVKTLRKIMAAVAVRQGDYRIASQIYSELLILEKSNLDSLLGLFSIGLLSRDLDLAGDSLNKLRVAGASANLVLQKSAEYNLAMGNFDQALLEATRLRDQDSKSAEPCILICEIWIGMYQSVEDKQLKANTMEKMNAAYSDLVYMLDTNDMRLLLLRGKMDLAAGNMESARSAFLRAAGMAPNSTLLLNVALQVDFKMGDKVGARTRATQILRRDTSNQFANYVMALISFDDGKLEDADYFLSRSLATGTFPEGESLRKKLDTAKAEDNTRPLDVK